MIMTNKIQETRYCKECGVECDNTVEVRRYIKGMCKRCYQRTKRQEELRTGCKQTRNTVSTWTKAEDELIRQLYPEQRISELMKRTGRTYNAIKKRASTLGVRVAVNFRIRRQKSQFCPRCQSTNIIPRSKLGGYRCQQCSACFSNPLTSTVGQIPQYKPDFRELSKSEFKYIKKQLGIKPIAEIADELEFDVDYLDKKISSLGIQKPKVTQDWNKSDERIVELYYPYLNTDVIAEYLNRTPSSVRIRAYVLGVNKKARSYNVTWSADELKKLETAVKSGRIEEFARWKGITIRETTQKAQQYGFNMNGRRMWSKEEDDIVKSYYPTHSVREVAEMLDRTDEAVKSRAKILGVRQRRSKYGQYEPRYRDGSNVLFISDDVMNALKQRYSWDDLETLARDTGLTVRQVHGYASKLGLNRYPKQMRNAYLRRLTSAGKLDEKRGYNRWEKEKKNMNSGNGKRVPCANPQI